jgi:uncharacterized protein DUF4148
VLASIKERIMKAFTQLTRTVFAALLVSASVSAFAGGGGPRGLGPNPYSGTATMAATAASPDTTGNPATALTTSTSNIISGATSGKSREQVRAELVRAEEAGLIPVHRNDYPPSAETIARNKVRFQQIEEAWQGNGGAMTTAEK